MASAAAFCACLICWTWPIAVRDFRASCALIDQTFKHPVSRFLSKLQPFICLFALIVAQVVSFNRLATAAEVEFADVFWPSMQLVLVVGILPAFCLAIVAFVLERVHPRIGG